MYSLLYLRICILRNSLKNLKAQDLFRFGIVAGIFAVVLVFGVYFAVHGFEFILKLPAMGAVIANSLVQLLFFVLFYFLIVSNVLLGYTYLFRSRRIESHFYMPLHPEAIFLLNSSGSIFQSSWASLVLVSSVLFSYGISHDAPLVFYFLVPVIVFPFLLLCGLIGLTLAFVLGVLRSRFGKKVFHIGGTGIVLIGVFFLADQVRVLTFTPGEELVSFTRLTEGLRVMNSPFWPGKWVSNSVFACANGYYSECFFAMGLLFASSAVFWPVLDLFGRYCYRVTWQRLSSTSGGSAKRGQIPLVLRPVPAILRKDMLLFARNPTQFLQLILFLLLMVLYTVSLLRLPQESLPSAYLQYVSLANLTAISFVLASFSSRFVYPLLDVEGRAVWILKTAPLPLKAVLAGKLIFGCLLMGTTAVLLSVTSQLALGVGAGEIVLGTVLVTALSLSLASVAMGFSAAFATFESDRPGEVLGTMGGTSNFLASLGFVCVIVAFWAVGIYLGRRSAVGLISTAATFLIIAGAFFASMAWSLRSLRKKEY